MRFTGLKSSAVTCRQNGTKVRGAASYACRRVLLATLARILGKSLVVMAPWKYSDAPLRLCSACQQRPSLAGLAADVVLAGVPLGVERVEVLAQALLRRLPGVDGAPDHRRRPRRVAVILVRHASLLAGARDYRKQSRSSACAWPRSRPCSAMCRSCRRTQSRHLPGRGR